MRRNKIICSSFVGRIILGCKKLIQRSARYASRALCSFGLSICLADDAAAETRSLRLFHIHTREKAEIIFKRDGRYDRAGLRKIDHMLRDWRRGEPRKMNPKLLDLLWEVYRASGAASSIHVIGGYRAPSTNSMLRSRARSSGVAEHSQHMLGNAIDFYVPGIPLNVLRETSLKMQLGGVGYYPKSGAPFVHLDVADARMWPRMSRHELARLFPKGSTVYLPNDGKPLPGYHAALACYNARKVNGESAFAVQPRLRKASNTGYHLILCSNTDNMAVSDSSHTGKDASASIKAFGELSAQKVPLPMSAPRYGLVASNHASNILSTTSGASLAKGDGSDKLRDAAGTIPIPEWRPTDQAFSDTSLTAAVAPLPAAVFVEPRRGAESFPKALEDVGEGRRRHDMDRKTARLDPRRFSVNSSIGSDELRDLIARLDAQPSSAKAAKKGARLRQVGSSSERSIETAMAHNNALGPLPWSVRMETSAPALGKGIFSAREFLRSKPSQMLAIGFEREAKFQDPQRFRGPAVEFLPLIYFDSNRRMEP